jgi:hypothetical protein
MASDGDSPYVLESVCRACINRICGNANRVVPMCICGHGTCKVPVDRVLPKENAHELVLFANEAKFHGPYDTTYSISRDLMHGDRLASINGGWPTPADNK